MNNECAIENMTIDELEEAVSEARLSTRYKEGVEPMWYPHDGSFRYTENINSAWELVEEVLADAVNNDHLWLIGWTTVFHATFQEYPLPDRHWWSSSQGVYSGKTAPIAICRAYLDRYRRLRDGSHD